VLEAAEVAKTKEREHDPLIKAVVQEVLQVWEG
jgi:hypothetical protein